MKQPLISAHTLLAFAIGLALGLFAAAYMLT